jgi:hypothetical protein
MATVKQSKGDSMFIEIDLVGDEEEAMADANEAPPENFEDMEEIDHLYMDDQLYLQSIFDL